jgi:hypothetical protein
MKNADAIAIRNLTARAARIVAAWGRLEEHNVSGLLALRTREAVWERDALWVDDVRAGFVAQWMSAFAQAAQARRDAWADAKADRAIDQQIESEYLEAQIRAERQRPLTANERAYMAEINAYFPL